MRRRLLLANSHAESGGGDLPSDGLPPESTSFGFPLYLNITTLDYEDDSIAEYMRPVDDVSNAFYDWLFSNKDSNDADGLVNIGDNEIYINGCLVTEVSFTSWYSFNFQINNPPFDRAYFPDKEEGLWGINYK